MTTKIMLILEDIKFTYKKRTWRNKKRNKYYQKRKQMKKKVEQFKRIDSTIKPTIKLQPLADEQKIVVHKALEKAKKDERVLIVDGEYGKLIGSDILLLRPRKWLNDEIINYYAAMLGKRSNSGKCKSSVVLLNSFFYTKLAGNGYDYGAVSRWTSTAQRRYLSKNVKTIFDLDKVIFPINIKDHWLCGCVNVKKKIIEFYCSMGSYCKELYGILKRYIEDEIKDKQLAINEDWDYYVTTDVPLQDNNLDCGVFTCMFMDCLCNDITPDFGQEYIDNFRLKIAYEIITNKLI
ncbi:Ulp1 protease family, catalytic domain containing protein [Reticulomyxa filosa]|uniref:Ulp1 protease family, catalytic domain containing protein n=1 Tax=Reticulomyxa filosa TaxID=46433 RepID=X6P3G9_RETFI|nr:Ulp1 protease family, catalytic domain containing protein [Reticulomyxa filosa]|eukprot:ETO32673.1 Ulp1 protease family, catalytic domain containing protein [Reticulomyxa filosa]